MKAHRKDINTAQRGVSLEHRHFSFIAAAIANWDDHMFGRQRKELAEHFANACRATNPRFDRARFLAACGMED